MAGMVRKGERQTDNKRSVEKRQKKTRKKRQMYRLEGTKAGRGIERRRQGREQVRWQVKVETFVSSPDPRFIHSTAFAHHPPTHPLTHSLSHAAVQPAIHGLTSTGGQVDTVCATTTAARVVCGLQSTGLRMRASLWSLRVPVVDCNQESCWPEPTNPAWAGTLGLGAWGPAHWVPRYLPPEAGTWSSAH